MTTVLIDGDVFAYRVAAAAETVVDWGNGRVTMDCDPAEATTNLDHVIEGFIEKMGAKKTLVALSAPRCFRYDILPTYKHNRRSVRRPILLSELKQHLSDKWEAKTKPKLEADDVLGIWATMPSLRGKKIIVSIDKDFKQVPGWLWNPNQDEAATRITEETADRWHMMQTLMGDTTDGYSGCPGIGPKKANDLLTFLSRGNWWGGIVTTFAMKGLTEADALQQARVARICRAADYDTIKQEPIPWTPPSSR